MDRESMERLRFDRRLMRRREWLTEGEYEAHLEALPDVSEKVATGAEEPQEPAASGVAGAPAAPATTASPAEEAYSGSEYPSPEGSSTPS